MKRVIINTQSNRLFKENEFEQNYDQRGCLCQAEKDDIIVTTNPLDPDYVDYWKSLGFDLPCMIVAGPFDKDLNVSQLIIQKHSIQKQIKANIGNKPARLEFFCIEEAEHMLSKTLQIPAYCDFYISMTLSRKLAFKELCQDLCITTPEWIYYDDKQKVFDKAKQMLESGLSILIKANDGMGGVACGGMFQVNTIADLESVKKALSNVDEKIFIEQFIQDKISEISVHWEISEKGDLKIIGLFEQISKKCSHGGVYWPVSITRDLQHKIMSCIADKIGPYLIKHNGKGFFCSDIVIDKNQTPYWIDFNPRKGAILFIHDMVKRISKIKKQNYYFWSEHIELPEKKGLSFQVLKNRLNDLLAPDLDNFVIITNSGVIPFGYVDITGLSKHSLSEAKEVFIEATMKLK